MRRILTVLLALSLASLLVVPTAVARQRTFVAHLTGASEVPPVATAAVGQTVLKAAKDLQSVSYRVNVANIDDVVAAHIHLGAEGTNGPVVAFLFAGGPVSPNGTLSTGTITDADLVGPLTGGSVASLVDAIASGDAYVNVHTTANPGGEIRGQTR